MTSWSDDRTLQLKTLWLAGHSASMVALALGGVTRNAVIGKVHRLGLSGRAAASAPGQAHVAAVVKTSRPPPRPSLRPRAAGSLPALQRASIALAGGLDVEAGTDEPRVRLLDLRPGGCRFGLGDPKSDTFGFCAATAVRGRYCARHAAIVFQPRTRRCTEVDGRPPAQLRRA